MDYRKYNDNELIYMVQENDEDSSNLLIKKYYPIIFSLSKEYFSKYDGGSYELDDFYQVALEAFYKAIHTYNNTMGMLFYSFNIMCIKRALLSFLRKVKGKDADSIDIGCIEYCLEDIEENPNVRDSFKGLEEIIKSVIFNSSLEVGAILELKVNGFTYKEISKLLDMPMSSVEFKSRKARNLLRSKVRAYYCK